MKKMKKRKKFKVYMNEKVKENGKPQSRQSLRVSESHCGVNSSESNRPSYVVRVSLSKSPASHEPHSLSSFLFVADYEYVNMFTPLTQHWILSSF